VDPLPIPEIARSIGPKGGAPRFRIEMRAAAVKLHRDLAPTPLWTYGGSFPGPTIEARRGHPVVVEWPNELPDRHFLAIDHRLHGAEADKPEVRAVVHLHGAKVPPQSDGYPEDWYTPGKSAVLSYPNDQDAALLWYHDHAMGITRLNIYAGLLGLCLLRDDFEDALHLPGGRYEIPLVLCDRFLLRDGSLDYPVSGDGGAPWVSEVFGNAMLVNGKLFPYLEVEPRKYRFRILNGANGRFFHLSLSNGQDFQVIGTDQGLLSSPVSLPGFVFAPGERADVVVDFKDYKGDTVVLRSDALELMQFRVGRVASPGTSANDRSLPATLRPVVKIPEDAAVRTRLLTIDEQMNGKGESVLMLLNKSHWHMPVTEKPVLNSVEIWSILNPTDDSHPIHLHMVRFQILDRRPFLGEVYMMTGEMKFTGPPVPPEPFEAGWKDTVRAHANMLTRIIIKFEGYPGRYVWHCHVLEHEDNEMMRPYEVVVK
jgi:spore coat protein A